MTNTQSFAKRELDMVVKSTTDLQDRPIIEPFIPEILALCEKFGESGQSGGSAPYTAYVITQALESLLLQKPICPVSGLDEEWVDVSQFGDGTMLYQNSRCSAAFKDTNGRAWYLDAISWDSETTGSWAGEAILADGIKLLSRAYIKSFPFEPRTFHIDVIEKEIAPGDWEFYVKDEKQLEEVFNYYDKYDNSNV